MAGDWIKMRSDLGMDPAVIRMSLATSLDPFGVVGRLHALWAWADAHTTNGLVSGVTSEWIDTFVRCPGFAEAMCGAGWLSQRPGGVEFPRFGRHMGDGAKARAQKTKRQQKWRNAGATPPKPPRVRAVDAGVDGAASTEAPPEKRREEKTPDSDQEPTTGDIGRQPRPEEVIAAWNAVPGLPPFEGQSPYIRRDIAARWGDQRFRTRWRDVMAALAKSDYHRGRNDDGFIATLSWFLGEKGFERSYVLLERQDAKATANPPRKRPVVTAADNIHNVPDYIPTSMRHG